MENKKLKHKVPEQGVAAKGKKAGRGRIAENKRTAYSRSNGAKTRARKVSSLCGFSKYLTVPAYKNPRQSRGFIACIRNLCQRFFLCAKGFFAAAS